AGFALPSAAAVEGNAVAAGRALAAADPSTDPSADPSADPGPAARADADAAHDRHRTRQRPVRTRRVVARGLRGPAGPTDSSGAGRVPPPRGAATGGP